MARNLEKILIRASQPDFDILLGNLRSAICKTATFNPRSDEGKKVAKIIERIWEKGDEAVAEYTEEFDKVKLTPEQFRVSSVELQQAHMEINKKFLKSLCQAIENVRKYQKEIFIGYKSTHPGIKYSPIKRIGICVPGASAPLPSTVIMTAVPAQVAGVKEITVVSPPRHKGTIHPVILATCYELGIDEVYRIGGVQAVAALANGTDKIKSVDKIVGPGNQWVQTAKRVVYGSVGIDSVAGPSEVLIIANERANPAWLAADMLSQAEHAPGSAVVFTDSQEVAEKTLAQLSTQLEQLDRAESTRECLSKHSGIVVFDNITEAVKWANDFATEHLQIVCGDKSREISEQIENAGAVFIGAYTPVAVGDYWAGPSHTLPTGGAARFSSALTSNDFVKSTSIIEYDKNKLANSAAHIIRLAEIEGLDAHARSIKIRQENGSSQESAQGSPAKPG